MTEIDEFIIQPEPFDWISKSRIQSWKYCDRQYYYFAIKQLTYTASPAMIRGRKFHYNSSKFYREVNINNDPEYEYYRGLLPQDKNLEINRLYDNFAQFEIERMKLILKDGLSPEHFFLPKLNEETIRLPEQKMSGHIDRVWLNFDKKLYGMVCDIKTGKITNKTSLRREGCFYIYLIQESDILDYIGCDVTHVGSYSPLNNDFWFDKLSKRTWTALYKTLDEMTYALLTRKKEEDWSKNLNANCSFCSYIEQCWKNEQLRGEEFVRKKEK